MSFRRYTIHKVSVVVFDEVFAEFIDGLISKVHLEDVHVGIFWFFVFVGAESHETILMDEYAEWVH